MKIMVALQYFKVVTERSPLMALFGKKFITFTKNVVKVEGKRETDIVEEEDYNFVGGSKFNNEYVFQITQLPEFLLFLRKHDFRSTDIKIEKVKGSHGLNIELDVNPAFTLRKYQTQYVNFIYRSSTSHKRTLIDLQTGKGKSLIGSATAAKLGKRIVIVVLPRYIEKWQGDVQKYTTATEEDFRTIHGSSELKSLLLGEYKEKIIIISTRTLLNYYDAYENDIYFDYPCPPTELANKTGIQTLLLDEVHQEFYVVYKTIMYFNMRRVIGMSATLLSNDKKENYLYTSAFPMDGRLSLLDLDRYVDIYAIEYYFLNGKQIRTYSRIEFGYQHVVFEKQLMKKQRKLQSYFNIIYYQLQFHYLKEREEGDKCLIFFSTVKMINRFHNYLKQKGLRDLSIRRYTAKDDLANLLNSDIVISTPGSAGTAHDIPGLTMVLNTVSIGSEKLNIQILGRLRLLPDKKLKYVFIWSRNIRTQQSHYLKRKKIMKERGKSFIDVKTNMIIS